MCEAGADFRVGNVHRHILLVGACPGREEEFERRPFAGLAGNNLRIMLVRLHQHDRELFPSSQPDHYSMLNAHTLPRYRGRPGFNGRTQPTRAEIMAPDNQERLIRIVNEVEPTLILYLGKVAEFIHPVIRPHIARLQAFRTGHPSTPAWNTRPEYAGLPRQVKLARWVRDRFEVVA